MNTQSLKDFLLFVLKSPAIWVALVALVNANQAWLFPSIPQQVMDSFNNLVTVVSGLVIAYLSGGYVQQQKTKRQALKLLAQEHPMPQKLEE